MWVTYLLTIVFFCPCPIVFSISSFIVIKLFSSGLSNLTHCQHFFQQAQFKNLSAVMMASFFAITTPTGIAAGVGLSSFYNANSPRALVVEGILDSVSAGILIYMALVDLIAADFLGGKMTGSPRHQVMAYVALFLGALSMSSLAVWA
jgi:hypothetical protein